MYPMRNTYVLFLYDKNVLFMPFDSMLHTEGVAYRMCCIQNVLHTESVKKHVNTLNLTLEHT